MTAGDTDALELAERVRALRDHLIESKPIHGGLGFTGDNLALLREIERFLLVKAVDGDRFQQAHKLVSQLQIMECTRGGSTSQETAIHDLDLLAGVLERLSAAEPPGTGAESQPVLEPPPDSPGEGKQHRKRRRSTQIESQVAARKVEEHLAVLQRRYGTTMQMFADGAGTTYQTLAKFLKTGRLKRDILIKIAETMELTLEELLAERDGQQQ